MSETIKVLVSKTAWTDITNGAKTGIITNNSQHSIRYRESESEPSASDTFGHILHPQDQMDYDLDGSTNIWALGFFDDAAVALTKNFGGAKLVNAMVEFAPSINLDTAGRLRTSEPFGILEFKNVITRNRNQFEEVMSGLILEYDTLVGGPFQVAEEIRGTGALIPIATINTDNGASSMNTDCNHNDFEIGMVITGQTSSATAVITSFNTGSNIAHHYDHASVDITAGVGATDFAFRQTHRAAPYVAGKSQYPTLTVMLPAKKENVLERLGVFDELDGLYLESTFTDNAFVTRTSTSGSAVNNRVPQNEWNIDRLDGGVSGGPNPSGVTLDITKVQYYACPYLWQGVGPRFHGLMINNRLIYCHEEKSANEDSLPYMRNPSLPVRYEIRNTGVPASPTTMEEICSTVSSEGGFTLPGLEFTATRGILAKAVDALSLQPVLAIRLKEEFPAGKGNKRIAKFLEANILTAAQDVYIEIHHVHEPIDITFGTGEDWADIGGGSGVEFSLDISGVTGRPAHMINADYVTTAAGNKAQGSRISAEFLNLHSFISQNFDSTRSEMFVIYAQALTGTANVRATLSFIEFD